MARAELQVEVVYCPGPGVVDLQTLALVPGATVADAVSASGIAARHGLDPAQLQLGVWGKPRPAETLLRDRDRVEVYRPLTVDPKEARRQRYRRHREKAAAR